MHADREHSQKIVALLLLQVVAASSQPDHPHYHKSTARETTSDYRTIFKIGRKKESEDDESGLTCRVLHVGWRCR